MQQLHSPHLAFTDAEDTDDEDDQPTAWRFISDDDKFRIRTALLSHKTDLEKTQSTFMAGSLIHGISAGVIDSVVNQSAYIASVEDILHRCPVFVMKLLPQFIHCYSL